MLPRNVYRHPSREFASFDFHSVFHRTVEREREEGGEKKKLADRRNFLSQARALTLLAELLTQVNVHYVTVVPAQLAGALSNFFR